MRAASAWIVLGIAALTITACSSGQRRGPPTKVINRVLATAPGEAQPSRIVAREIELAQAARAEGQYSAASRFAANGALLHRGAGPVAAQPFFAGSANPAQSDARGTAAVVMSCDGALAVTQGRFRDAAGIVGNYVTVWQRGQQGDGQGSYNWVYDAQGADDPQPPPRKEFEDGDIVVIAIPSVQGLIATCPRGAVGTPAPPAIAIGEEGASDAQLSRDGTLRWRWEHRQDGTKYVSADYFYEGEWVTAIEETLASSSE